MCIGITDCATEAKEGVAQQSEYSDPSPWSCKIVLHLSGASSGFGPQAQPPFVNLLAGVIVDRSINRALGKRKAFLRVLCIAPWATSGWQVIL